MKYTLMILTALVLLSSMIACLIGAIYATWWDIELGVKILFTGLIFFVFSGLIGFLLTDD